MLYHNENPVAWTKRLRVRRSAASPRSVAEKLEIQSDSLEREMESRVHL